MLSKRNKRATTETDFSAADIIRLGEMPIHESEATNHFLYAGATGSGKTTLLRAKLQGFIPTILPGTDRRALLTNPKQDWLPILHGMSKDVEIITLDPYDARGAAYDIASDVPDVRTAIQTAFTLFPSQSTSQPFFEHAVRHCAFGVIMSFKLSEIHWTLADLVRVLRSEDHLRAVLRKHSYTAPIYDLYFRDERLGANVMASIATRLLPFEPIASAWEDASGAISLTEWATRECVLLLPHCEISREATDAINRVIFKRASDVTLNQSESFTRRSWFILDELSDCAKLDGLVSLMKKSRSKGGCVSLAFQSVSGLRHEQKYGPHFTDEILGQVGNRFFGRLECPETAEWASKLIGDQEVEGVSRSTTFGSETTASETSQLQMRRAVLPSELMAIEPCGIDTGLSGFFLIRSAGAFFSKLDAKELFTQTLLPAADIPEFQPRAESTQLLRLWSPDEAARFGAVLHALEQASHPQNRSLEIHDLNDLFDN